MPLDFYPFGFSDNAIRKGTSVALSLKRARPTLHYIWRTRRDSKVRSSHAANDGKIFSWDNPPSTGHPGVGYGCRCRAEAYNSIEAEFFDITFRNVSDTSMVWTSTDFVRHYFLGNGRTVTVRETGHLTDIVARYRQIVIDDPKRLPKQIANIARQKVGTRFTYEFYGPYPMTDIVFSIGDTVIEGKFSGSNNYTQGFLEITGDIKFDLKDKFKDPTDVEERRKQLAKFIDEIIVEAINNGMTTLNDIFSYVAAKIGSVDRSLRAYIYERATQKLRQTLGNLVPKLAVKAYPELPGGTPYAIIDHWNATVSARVLLDAQKSRF